jgi:hypothetical protein
MFTKRATSALCLATLILLVSPVFGQRTRVQTGFNLFTPQQDVEMGRVLAQDAESTLNLSQSNWAHGYINALGSQVAAHAPGYRYPFEFKIYNDPSIQSIALPGGKIYFSSGLIAAAQNEPQLAAIVAHQIAHVVARHGTERVSSAYSGRTDRRSVSVTEAIESLGLRPDPGSILLKYSPQEEQEADTIAVQMLYDERFDPRQLPIAMQRLASQPNTLRQEFFRDHPEPANRTAAVRRELQRLGPLAANLRGDSPDLRTAQQNLRSEDVNGQNQVAANRPDLPSNRFVTYQGYDFEIRHPENWYVNETGNTITLAPEGGNVSGTLAYGMLIDTFQPRDRDFFPRNSFNTGQQQRSSSLSSATDQLIEDLRRTNANLRVVRTVQKQVAGLPALQVELTNDSSLGGREADTLTTVFHNDVLYYFLGVAPQGDVNRYTPVFDRMIGSIRFF